MSAPFFSLDWSECRLICAANSCVKIHARSRLILRQSSLLILFIDFLLEAWKKTKSSNAYQNWNQN